MALTGKAIPCYGLLVSWFWEKKLLTTELKYLTRNFLTSGILNLLLTVAFKKDLIFREACYDKVFFV